jgi:hypothetical protein
MLRNLGAAARSFFYVATNLVRCRGLLLHGARNRIRNVINLMDDVTNLTDDRDRGLSIILNCADSMANVFGCLRGLLR